MGINERKERERDAVKDLILSAAREIFLAEGYETPASGKSYQDRIQPRKIHNHFRDKNNSFCPPR
jgi:hypothetical protein